MAEPVVTVTGPLGTPENTASTMQAGGTLDASTTYYYRIIAYNLNRIGYRYPEFRRSATSVEDSFTTTDTNKTADLSWDAVDGATHYMVLISKDSGDYSGTDRIIPPSGNDYATTDTNSYTVSAPATSNVKVSWSQTSSVKPGGFDQDQGNILVDLYGDCKLEDVYDAIVDAGYSDYVYWDRTNFVLDGSIYITDQGETGTLTVERGNLTFLGIFYNDADSGVEATFGTATGNSYQNMVFFHLIDRGRTTGLKANTTLNGVVFVNGCYDKVSNSYLYGDVRLNDIKSSFNGVVLTDGVQFDGLDGDTPIYRCATSWLLYSGTDAKTFTCWDVEIISNKATPIYPNSGVNPIIAYRVKVNNKRQYDVLSKSNSNPCYDFYLYDCEFPFRQLNKPLIYWRQYNADDGYHQKVNLYYSFLLKNKDATGTAIPEATVVITNNLGSEAVNTTTNTDGYLLEDKITITSVSSSTITDSSKSWDTDEHRGKQVVITSGGNAGMLFVIKSNTSDTLTLHDEFAINPEIGDRAGLPYFLQRSQTVHNEDAGQGTGSAYQIETDYNPYTVTITKAGYKPRTIKYTMDEKRVEIEKLTADGTDIQGSTLYDSTIY